MGGGAHQAWERALQRDQRATARRVDLALPEGRPGAHHYAACARAIRSGRRRTRRAVCCTAGGCGGTPHGRHAAGRARRCRCAAEEATV